MEQGAVSASTFLSSTEYWSGLRNDAFHLLGVETEGNKEFLVRGGLLPPRVDVISYTQDVSFKEMVSRLNRIRHMEKRKKTIEK